MTNQRTLLLHFLKDEDFSWTDASMKKSCVSFCGDEGQGGIAPEDADLLCQSFFPNGISDVIRAFSDMLDEEMMAELNKTDLVPTRIRDKIAFAVETRLMVMQKYIQQERACIAAGLRRLDASLTKNLWMTADHIWVWAGDNSEDYNYYTKRGLLSGVIASTTVFWLHKMEALDLEDEAEASTESDLAMQETRAFLNRRIENVLSIGKVAQSMTKLKRKMGQSES